MLNASVHTDRSNISSQIVFFKWSEPLSPNGVILAYQIDIKSAVPGSTGTVGTKQCISRTEFENAGKRYALTESTKLPPGKWSAVIRTMTSAGLSNDSQALEFVIVDHNDSDYMLYLILGILLLAFIVISMSTSWYIFNKTHTNIPNMEYVSMNPEYISGKLYFISLA